MELCLAKMQLCQIVIYPGVWGQTVGVIFSPFTTNIMRLYSKFYQLACIKIEGDLFPRMPQLNITKIW